MTNRSGTSPPLFAGLELGPRRRAELDERGYLALPGVLAPETCAHLAESLAKVADLQRPFDEGRRGERQPGAYAAENDRVLAGWIAHPQLLSLARFALGDPIRFDHCVALNRHRANRGVRWHAHEYADADPSYGLLRIFFYLNGFEADDGGLCVVPGSHWFRDSAATAEDDETLARTWLAGKRHPVTGAPLGIERLSAPPATVVLMWTHVLHHVTPRKPHSPTRWAVVYAYRNPGQPSPSRWISPEFESHPPSGTRELMPLD